MPAWPKWIRHRPSKPMIAGSSPAAGAIYGERQMKSIELWDDQDFTGVIILDESGQIWSNQVGGTACMHPKAKGIFINLPSYRFDTGMDNPWNDFVGSQENPYDPAYVQEFLDYSGCDQIVEPLTQEEYQSIPDGSRRCCEAWIPVKVRDVGVVLPVSLEPFRGRIGIITHENSD